MQWLLHVLPHTFKFNDILFSFQVVIYIKKAESDVSF